MTPDLIQDFRKKRPCLARATKLSILKRKIKIYNLNWLKICLKMLFILTKKNPYLCTPNHLSVRSPNPSASM